MNIIFFPLRANPNLRQTEMKVAELLPINFPFVPNEKLLVFRCPSPENVPSQVKVSQYTGYLNVLKY